jgi:hypothetical protein
MAAIERVPTSVHRHQKGPSINSRPMWKSVGFKSISLREAKHCDLPRCEVATHDSSHSSARSIAGIRPHQVRTWDCPLARMVASNAQDVVQHTLWPRLREECTWIGNFRLPIHVQHGILDHEEYLPHLPEAACAPGGSKPHLLLPVATLNCALTFSNHRALLLTAGKRSGVASAKQPLLIRTLKGMELGDVRCRLVRFSAAAPLH